MEVVSAKKNSSCFKWMFKFSVFMEKKPLVARYSLLL